MTPRRGSLWVVGEGGASWWWHELRWLLGCLVACVVVGWVSGLLFECARVGVKSSGIGGILLDAPPLLLALPLVCGGKNARLSKGFHRCV